ncbi:MAG: hypothetical protein M1308_11020 [Actinobacteria bacterium]|nr:hypothetical protein [Actinomycetota bacterium]
MLDIEKIKRAQVIPRRMFLINYMSEKLGKDIRYLFGLLNMYNTRNRGRWFWQKASFTGALKDDFDKFNCYMDKFSTQFKSYDESGITESLDEAQILLEKLMSELERNLLVNRETDDMDVKACVDVNIENMIRDNLKGL